ncbi:ABC transporter permease, partial [Bifidobacterium angulatum]|uniref:ABC transporter permease n=1 Tax=Bifidobacterium angulatum TaxID=1683 RepID=UPI002E76A671
TCKRVVVDQEATAKAQADYQAQVQAKVQSLQTEAQTLLAAGDQVGAKAKADEAQQAVTDAQNVDPATLVKTKDEPTKAVRRIGAIISNSVYRTAVFMNDEQAENLTNKEALFTIMVFVTARHGSDVAGLRGKILKQTKPYYVLTVQDHDEYKSTVSSLVDQMLIVLYALLALSIIIAIFGIVNTLALSVSERTREIGLLRAIGTSKAKIRGMLAIEAALISVLGTVIGLVVGTAAGVVIQQTYKASGMEQLAIPWGQLGVFLLLSIGIGVLASLPPSRRALKAPVLDAVASE